MPLILPVKGILPTIGLNCFIAPNATIVGDVIMGDQCSIWFNSVVRGDVNSIRMGNKVKDRKSTRLNSSHVLRSRMPSSA